MDRPRDVNALHSSRVFSVPRQFSWSRKIGPVPLLKAVGKGTAPGEGGGGSHVSKICTT